MSIDNTESSQGQPVIPLPNVVAAYREDLDQSIDWQVSPSLGAFGSGVDFVKGVLSVPLSGDRYSQMTQLREIVRLRSAPTDPQLYKHIADHYKQQGLTEQVIRAADEGRLNAITRKFAEVFDLTLEPDGSEKVMGKRLATSSTPQDWNRCVEFTAQHFGTKAFDSFASGVRSVKSEWSKQLTRLNKELCGAFTEDVSDLGATRPVDYGNGKIGPSGVHHTIYAASILSNYIDNNYRAPESVRTELAEREDKRAQNYGQPDPERVLRNYERLDPESELDTSELPDDFEFETDPDEDDSAEERFGPLIFNEDLPLTVEVKGYMARRRRANNIGRSIVYPSRMITDPERRVFGNKVRTRGGVFVLDISGSMHVSQSDIEAIVEIAPAALIMAYSDPDNGDGLPNAHILAKRGWRVKEFSDVRRGGNGVDGTALTWALRHKKPGEDVVWVSDGQVFGISGCRSSHLAVQCAQLVKKHKIIMIPSIREAIAACQTGRPLRSFNKPVGPIRDALLGNY